MNRLVILALLTASMTLAVLAQNTDQTQQSTISPNVGEQRAIDQLRAIVETIKRCSPFQIPPDIDMQGFISTVGPPENVVWNVELHPSIRGRYVASIEFYEPSSLKPPPEDVICNKKEGHVAYCKHVWEITMHVYDRQVAHPLHFKYEFDVTSHGLEFLDAFTKITQTDGEPWVAGGLDSDGCASKAIKSVLDKTGENAQTAVSEAKDRSQSRPSEIPKTLWDAAMRGDAGAQYTLGTMYTEGNGVPQDYVEAYFWLDIAASDNSDSAIRDVITKDRDTSASHLTPTLLLQTQERARKWVEDHIAQTNP